MAQAAFDTSRQEATSLLFRNAGGGQLVTIINATILVWVLGGAHPQPWALIWWGVVACIAVSRYGLARAFLARHFKDASTSLRWRRAAVAGALAAGLTWAAGSAAMMYAEPGITRLFVAMVSAGMIAGAVPILSSVPQAFRAYAIPISVAVISTALFDAHSQIDWALALVAVIFVGALLWSSRFFFATLDRSSRLALDMRALAGRLESSEHLFRTLAESTSVAIFTYGDRFEYVNPAGERLSGYTCDELRSMSIADVLHPDDRAVARQRASMRLESRGDFSQHEYRILTKSGAVRWVLLHGAPVVVDGRPMGLGSAVDITGMKQATEAIRKLAYYDPLTHLPNRRLLLDRLKHALHASDRSKLHGALLILDIDQFKTLNDTEGHDVGDRFLREVAGRLLTCVREDDTVARLGGDEYVILLEGLGSGEHAAAANAERVAEKILVELARPYALNLATGPYHSTVSIGLALFFGSARLGDVVLKEADVALYQAKDAGRNVVRFFNPEMQASIASRLATITAMRRGLEREEFALHYQPQVDDAGRRVGAEALLRWTSADRGAVSPAVFIPLAEESGLILPLGQQVLDTACRQLRDWGQDPSTRDLRLAVNVSAKQFHQPDFVAMVQRAIEVHTVDPRRLTLELTESIVLGNVDAVVERMNQLRAIGVEFSLDDFGTGYSSLSYLKRLPLSQVKIDQSFVCDAPTDDNDAAIVKAILALCGALGLRVVAEGVERPDQLAFLKANGCREFQGYLFGRPVPIAQWSAAAP